MNTRLHPWQISETIHTNLSWLDKQDFTPEQREQWIAFIETWAIEGFQKAMEKAGVQLPDKDTQRDGKMDANDLAKTTAMEKAGVQLPDKDTQRDGKMDANDLAKTTAMYVGSPAIPIMTSILALSNMERWAMAVNLRFAVITLYDVQRHLSDIATIESCEETLWERFNDAQNWLKTKLLTESHFDGELDNISPRIRRVSRLINSREHSHPMPMDVTEYIRTLLDVSTAIAETVPAEVRIIPLPNIDL
jgi:hypothetical protein